MFKKMFKSFLYAFNKALNIGIQMSQHGTTLGIQFTSIYIILGFICTSLKKLIKLIKL